MMIPIFFFHKKENVKDKSNSPYKSYINLVDDIKLLPEKDANIHIIILIEVKVL